MRFVLSSAKGEIDRVVKELQAPLATAATETVREAGEIALEDGRQSIASAGFSARWRRGLRATMDPKSGVSLTPSVRISHRIPYAGIFEHGGPIHGKPLLWVPLPAMKKLPLKRKSPGAYVRAGGKLHSVNRPGRAPLLVGSLSTDGKDKVPLFVGVPTITIRKRFNVLEAVQRAADRLGELLAKHLS